MIRSWTLHVSGGTQRHTTHRNIPITQSLMQGAAHRHIHPGIKLCVVSSPLLRGDVPIPPGGGAGRLFEHPIATYVLRLLSDHRGHEPRGPEVQLLLRETSPFH